ELDLSRNILCKDGARSVGEMLKRNDGIVKLSLDLSWNGIRKRGAKAFCDGLAENATLENMNLSWNGLGREGCKALEHCLQENRVLKNLDLTCNRIDFIALKPLVNALVKNETLRNIKVSDLESRPRQSTSISLKVLSVDPLDTFVAPFSHRNSTESPNRSLLM
ncbi:hypothetical protein LOTGIDRAFT_112947, partial [Lottia gigantea]